MGTKKYKKEKIASVKGFGEQSRKKEEMLREQGIFYVIGYGKWLEWSSVEPDCFTFTQSFWDEANKLFDYLAKNQIIEAVSTLRKGPWSSDDIGLLLRELDRWAMLSNPERAIQGSVTTRTLRELHYFGLESYHDALCRKHSESVSVTEKLQEFLEDVGLEFIDTGAYYDKEGNQDGPRDLVVGVPGTSTEYSFRVYHYPKKAEYEGTLPEEVKKAVQLWQEMT
jgi:hypothetical protein